MSALDEILKVAKTVQFPFEMIDKAAVELAELQEDAAKMIVLGDELSAMQYDRDQLRAENAEMREALEEIKKLDFRGRAVRNFHTAGEMNNIARAVLAKYPEVK